MLKTAFLIFREFGGLTRPCGASLQTPSPYLFHPDANRAALCPMGSRRPVLTLFVKASGSNQGKVIEQVFPNICIYKINSCFFYRSARFTMHIAQYIYRLTVHIAHSHIFMLFVRAVNTFLSLFYLMSRNLEAIHRTLARSVPSSAVVCPAVAPLVPVLFLQVRMLLLRQISNSRWLRLGCLND